MIFNERVLRLVLTLAEELHFGRTANRLHLSQPALSGAIKDLELELGVRLFRRNPRNVELTDAGRVFVTEARRLVQESELAVALVRRSAQDVLGPLRIGYPATIDHRWLWSLVPKLQSDSQFAVTPEFISSDAAELRELVVRGAIHAALLTGCMRDQSLECVPLFRQSIAVALPLSHPLAGVTSFALTDLEETPVVLLRRDRDPAAHDHLLALCGLQGYRPKIVQSVDTYHECLHFVSAGLGVAFVPAFLRSAASTESVVIREFPEGALYLDYALTYRRDAAPELPTFAKFLQQHIPAAAPAGSYIA